MSEDNSNDNLPPLDEARFSKTLRTALDQLTKISLDTIAMTVQLHNMETELVKRRQRREKGAPEEHNAGREE